MTPTGSRATGCSPRRSRSRRPTWPRLTDAQRRRVTGLHPDRAPTIVAGVIILRECIRALGTAPASRCPSTTSCAAPHFAAAPGRRCRRIYDCSALTRRSIIPRCRVWVTCRTTRRPAWYIGPGEVASAAPPAAWAVEPGPLMARTPARPDWASIGSRASARLPALESATPASPRCVSRGSSSAGRRSPGRSAR